MGSKKAEVNCGVTNFTGARLRTANILTAERQFKIAYLANIAYKENNHESVISFCRVKRNDEHDLWVHSRSIHRHMPVIVVGDTTLQLSSETLEMAVKLVEMRFSGLKVVYADTDSLFVDTTGLIGI